MAYQEKFMRYDALHAFLAGLIDYAGLFPPASLDLTTAINNYAHYLRCDDQWMLARFIVPANRLAELTDTIMTQFSTEYPLFLSVLCTQFPTDIGLIADFYTHYSGIVKIDVIETKLPLDSAVEPYLAAVTAAIERSKLLLRPFLELPFNAQWDAKLESTLQTLADYNVGRETAVGFKLRCGGVTADMFPSPAQVSRAIILCRDYGIPMKATAGLHHPLRRFDASVNTKMHGFLNVFGGGMLAHAFQLTLAELEIIITTENPTAFTFSENEFAWHDLTIKSDQINILRERQLTAFGSCSFDEPREDLLALGFLTPSKSIV